MQNLQQLISCFITLIKSIKQVMIETIYKFIILVNLYLVVIFYLILPCIFN
jgi:hypothetical protein